MTATPKANSKLNKRQHRNIIGELDTNLIALDNDERMYRNTAVYFASSMKRVAEQHAEFAVGAKLAEIAAKLYANEIEAAFDLINQLYIELSQEA